MVLEVTLIDVIPGRADDFLTAFPAARAMLAGAAGCRSIQLKRSADSVNRFVLLTEWESLESHERTFRRTERFAQWRALIGGSLAQPPLAEFFTAIPATADHHSPAR